MRAYDPFGPTSASYNLLIGTAVRDQVSGTPQRFGPTCAKFARLSATPTNQCLGEVWVNERG